jgi:DNA repair protein RadC
VNAAVPTFVEDGATEPTVVLPADELPRARDSVSAYVPESRPGRTSTRPQILRAHDVWLLLKDKLEDARVEQFWVLALDARRRLIASTMEGKGSLDACEVHPRDIFRGLIEVGAHAAIFVHNHPSGDPTPSRADLELTVRLLAVGEICGIKVHDHVVIGADGYVSIASNEWR